ncbi:MAG TPA: M56 family metallopeptidase [Sphingomicrobium sp.]|nr:M56 family metallopeptidase [Sphingomicrobium sp.]
MSAWLVDTLVATTLLMTLVLLVREPVRRRFGAGVAYGLWLIPAARLAMPTLTTTVERQVPAIEPAALAMTSASFAPTPAAPVDMSLVEQLGGWDSIALALWIAGSGAMLVRTLLVYRRQRRAVLDDSVQLARLDGIRIVRSGAVGGPLAFGIFDRVIAVPIDFDERFAAHQRRLALDHELAHHRCGDIIANHLAYGLLCAMWFNPLAWLSHAAFRFDQEAACDARVLEKANADDRAAYGQAIAKAASGRALLFAGALDRPTTLQRRLGAMLTTPDSTSRITGKALIAAAAVIALPLTASWATRYVDVEAPAAPKAPVPPVAAVAPVAAIAPIAPIAQVAPIAPIPPTPRNGERIMINGQEKDWDDLTPEERAEIRRELAQARAELSKVDMDEVRRDIREAMSEVKIDKEEMRRELANAKIEVDEAMREIDANAAELRRAGQDPERIKAQVRAGLDSVKAIDVDAITRQAMAGVDEKVIAASLKAAEAGLREAERELDRIERKTRR